MDTDTNDAAETAVETSEAGITGLSFVSVMGDVTDFWAVEHTGNWVHDNEVGRSAAAELVALMQADDFPIYLSSVARAIIAKGVCSGVEVGFFTGIGSHTIR